MRRQEDIEGFRLHAFLTISYRTFRHTSSVAKSREERCSRIYLPKEIARREQLRERMLGARRKLEARERGQGETTAEDEDGEDPPKSAGGGSKATPEGSKQINLTDPESALMRRSWRDSYEQAYNAQAVADAEVSQLILATDVIRTPSDANQLEPALEKVTEAVGPVQRMLADGAEFELRPLVLEADCVLGVLSTIRE